MDDYREIRLRTFLTVGLTSLCLVTFFFSCKNTKSNGNILIKGYFEGTTTIRELDIYEDNTFELINVNFFDKKIIYGVWDKYSDNKIILMSSDRDTNYLILNIDTIPAVYKVDSLNGFKDILFRSMVFDKIN